MNPSTVQQTVNYLIPSSGTTHAVPVSGVFSGTPVTGDWTQFAADQFPFQPQGCFIDNTQGTGPLTLSILSGNVNSPVFWNVVCPAGAQKTANFPAPNGQSFSITGSGQATVIFVDFPVLPDAGAVTVENTVNVDVISPNPLPTQPTVNSGGTPYQNTEVPVPVTAYYNGAITGGTTSTGNITPAPNTNLRKLILTLSDNATLAAAGLEVVTATLNGQTIYKESVYIPASAPVNASGAYWMQTLDFAKLGLNVGAGSLVVTVGTALATGILEVNAYFG